MDRSYPKGVECIEKQISGWNQQGTRMKRRLKQTCEKTVLEKAGKCGKTWSEVTRSASNKSQMKMLQKCHMFLM